MDIEDVIRNAAEEIINMMRKKILLFVSGGGADNEEIFKTLSSMNLFEYHLVMSEEAKKVIEQQYIKELNCKIIEHQKELNTALRKDDLIVVPIMTRNTLVKCALGIEDSLLTTGIARAFMMNKKVIVVKNSFDPESFNNIQLGFSKNTQYNKMLLSYEKTIEDFGAKLIEACNLKDVLSENFSIKEDSQNKVLSGVVTVKDIIGAVSNNIEISVKKGSIITPLAKDYIDNNSIKVKFC